MPRDPTRSMKGMSLACLEVVEPNERRDLAIQLVECVEGYGGLPTLQLADLLLEVIHRRFEANRQLVCHVPGEKII